MPEQQYGNPAMGYAPAAQDTGNPGAVANAVAQIQQAIRIIETAMPAFQPGTKAYNAVIDSLKKLSTAFPQSEGSPGVQETALETMANEQQKTAPIAAIMRAMASGQAQGQEPQQLMAQGA